MVYLFPNKLVYISTKPSDKNIPNICKIFRTYQIKNLYIRHFENMAKFSHLVHM